jgi:anaerobic ribonucleoside-triphosphate reductase
MEKCAVCGKKLGAKEGIVSSTGVLVCSDKCKEKFLDTIPNRGKSPLVVYSRVTGYITPVNAWNKGKLQEHRDRVLYSVSGGVAE